MPIKDISKKNIGDIIKVTTESGKVIKEHLTILHLQGYVIRR